MENTSSLNGKSVLVLGGTSGIGLATAKAAAVAGALVTIVSGNQQRVDQALTQLPNTSKGFVVNLSQEANIRSFFAGYGNFDHLVYTAGENIKFSNIVDTDLDDARDYFSIRYWGAVAAVKYAVPHINAGGSVSLMSGTAAQRPGAGWSLVSSICGAMESFTRSMAAELAPIRVNAIAAGIVRTNLWNSMPEADREGLYKSMGDALLVKRIGEAEDIAGTFLYLMQQQYGTGQILTVDGGSSLI